MELLALAPDVIVTSGASVTEPVREATTPCRTRGGGFVASPQEVIE
jgi:hypothetical protein